MAELGPVGGIEEGAGALAGPRREEIAIEGHDDEEKDVLSGGRGVADQDMSSLAQPEAVPAEVVEEDAAQRQEPDAEGDHDRPEEERDEAHEECRVERRQDDDRESAEGGAQAEDLEVHVAQGAGKPFIAEVLCAQADSSTRRPRRPVSPAAPTRKPKPPSSVSQASRLGWPPSAPTSDSCK